MDKSLLQSAVDDILKRIHQEEATEIKIALLGRGGAGKSSLINALLGQDKAEVGIENDVTIEAKSYDWNGLHLVDLPGFDTEMFPRDTFYDDFDLDQYDLFLCVFDGKLGEADMSLFRTVMERGRSFQFVRTKWDAAKQKGFTPDQLAERVTANVSQQFCQDIKVSFVSSVDSMQGMDSLQMIIMDKLPETKRRLWAMRAKAYSHEFLEQKRRKCEQTVTLYAGLSAVGSVAASLIPVPGSGVLVDAGVLLTLFSHLRKHFGIMPDEMKEVVVPKLAPIINRLFEYGSKKGIPLLLSQYGGKTAVRGIAKIIPFVGQVIAGSIGFAITHWAGRSYLNDCYEVAKGVLEQKISRADNLSRG